MSVCLCVCVCLSVCVCLCLCVCVCARERARVRARFVDVAVVVVPFSHRLSSVKSYVFYITGPPALKACYTTIKQTPKVKLRVDLPI